MFRSFIQAGFEGSTGYNRHRQWIDQIAATQHDLFADEDYQRLRDIGIRTVRETVRWPLVDRRGRYDFNSLRPFLEAANRHGIEIIFDLFHFGYPEDLDLFSPEFALRFADYCHAAASYIRRHMSGTYYFTPVNEPSFFSWAAGEVGLFAPHANGRGWELKVRLIEAAIAGINAIWDACPGARIVNVDPLCRVATPVERPELQAEVDYFNQHVVFQSWDMLSGRVKPELGGSPRHLDIIGINYYWTNQWEWGRAGDPLASDDPRCCRLSDLIRTVWGRYEAEMLITETSELGPRRAAWLYSLANEVEEVLEEGLPLHGVCIYPVLGMPEWHAREVWTQMGLWDLAEVEGVLHRLADEAMFQALKEAQRLEKRRSKSTAFSP